MRGRANVALRLLGVAIATTAPFVAAAPAFGTDVPLNRGLDVGIIPGETQIPAGFNTNTFTTVNQYSPRPAYLASSTIKICNRFVKVGRVTVKGTASSGKFTVRYFTRRQLITDRVTAGVYQTRYLARGECATIFMQVHATKTAQQGDEKLFVIKAVPQFHPKRFDRVGSVVHDQRPPETPVIVKPARAYARGATAALRMEHLDGRP